MTSAFEPTPSEQTPGSRGASPVNGSATAAGSKDMISRVASMSAELDSLQHSLEASRVENDALRARVSRLAAAPPPAPQPDEHLPPIGDVINEIVEQARTAARDRLADANREADEILRKANDEAAAIRAGAERIKAEAERDAQEYRVETMAHASRLQNETEAALEKVRADAADTMATIEHEVATELVARLQIVRESERAVLDRLAATADAINRCLAWFDDQDAAPGARREIDLRVAPAPTNGTDPR